MSIAHQLRGARPVTPKAPPVKAKSYVTFIHALPCVVSGVMPVQAAHLSFAAPEWGHFGRGKGQKASDRWVLPLCEKEHVIQHGMNEKAYWKATGIDPHRLACVLWGLWSERGDEALPHAIKIIRSAK
jgi:hypothetical protein